MRMVKSPIRLISSLSKVHGVIGRKGDSLPFYRSLKTKDIQALYIHTRGHGQLSSSDKIIGHFLFGLEFHKRAAKGLFSLEILSFKPFTFETISQRRMH